MSASRQKTKHYSLEFWLNSLNYLLKSFYSPSLEIMIPAVVTTALTTPQRVLMNNASIAENVIHTIQISRGRFLKGAPLNIMRGSVSTSCQMFAQKLLIDESQEEGSFAWIKRPIAACLGSYPASIVENMFIRKNASLTPLFNYNPRYAVAFGLREFFYAGAVYAIPSDIGYGRRSAFTLLSVVPSQIAHKFVNIHAIEDSSKFIGKLPNYTEGMSKVFKNIAYGLYSQDLFPTPIKHPKNLKEAAWNIWHGAFGGNNMLIWRYTYVITFAIVLNYLRTQTKQFNERRRNDHAHLKLFQPPLANTETTPPEHLLQGKKMLPHK